MHAEERKREKRLPPPAGELIGDRGHAHRDAAPFYIEDQAFYDFQEAHLASLALDTRNHPNERTGQSAPVRKINPNEHKEVAEHKEKCLFLEAELQNTKIKMGILETENEKLQEGLNTAQSDRKNYVLQLEIERLQEENETLAKQSEYLEKTLKLERVKFSQDLRDLRNQLKEFRDLNFLASSREHSSEINETLEENHKLKLQVINLEREKSEILRKHREELKEKEIYHAKLLENRDIEEQVYMKANTQEKYQERRPFHDPLDELPQFSEAKQHYTLEKLAENDEEVIKSLDIHQKRYMNMDVHEDREPLYVKSDDDEEIQEPKEEPDQGGFMLSNQFDSPSSEKYVDYDRDNYSEEVEEVINLSDNERKVEIPESPNRNQGLNALFDSIPQTEVVDNFGFASGKGQVLNLFDEKLEESDNQAGLFPPSQTGNWFDQEPEELYSHTQNNYTANEEENLYNAEDFFSHLGDHNPGTSTFQTIPRSLFD